MKVAIISSGCRPVLDGVTVSLHHRLKRVSSLGHEALVFCPDYEDMSHKYPDYKSWTGNILPGVEVMSLPSEPIPGVEFERNYNWQAGYDIDAALDNFQPDIIHVDEPERIAVGMWGVPGVSFAERHSKPIVAMYRTNFIDMLDDLNQPLILQWLGQTILQRVYWSYDATLVSNRITEEKINQLGIENTLSGRFVGIDLDVLNAVHEEENNSVVDVPDDKVVLSFVGRLTADKGWPFILETFKQVAQEKADWLGHIFIVVAGDGELYNEIKDTLESIHVPAAMLGRVAPEKLPHVLAKTDVCVTASEKETQGNALLECLATKSPIVAPNVGGHLSFSQDGKNSILFPPSDSASFAQSIESLVYDAKLRETLGKQGNKDAQEYGMDTVVSNLLDTWEDFIQNHQVEDSLAISTQQSFLIQKRNHAKSGFWGRPDATHQFCEPHYATTFFAAEAWNALSSLVFLFGALLAYRHSKSKFHCSSERIKLSCWLLAVVGLGSTLFHLTMRHSMQLLDEVPMILYVSSLLASKLDKIPSTNENQSTWRNFIGTYVVSLIYLYQAFGFYQVFFIGFIILWFCDAFATAQVWHHGDRKHGVKSFTTIVIAAILWLIEDGLCETYPSVWILHVVWHFLTCYSSYHIILFNASIGRKKAKEDIVLFHGPLIEKMVDPFHGARILQPRASSTFPRAA